MFSSNLFSFLFDDDDDENDERAEELTQLMESVRRSGLMLKIGERNQSREEIKWQGR